jgi:uncharacterized coiled-coil DUF342 family protein
MAGGLTGLGTFLAVGLAIWRAPSRVAAALLLDERFGLKERATTSLMLAPEQAPLPAAQALLADVNDRVGGLDISSGFPVRLNWHAALVPFGALLLSLVAVFYDPPRTTAGTTSGDEMAQAPTNKAEIEQKMKELEKRVREKRAADKVKDEKADPLDEELQKILNKPRDTKEEVRDRIKDLTALEEKIRSRQDAMAQKAQAVKDQLQQMNRMAGMDTKDGPAKGLQKALEKGDTKKAEEEVEKLIKKMKENQLSDEEKKQLVEQLKDLKEKIQRLSNLNEEEERLKELNRQGKLDQDQLNKALEGLRKCKQQLSANDQKQLEEMADALKQCQECLSKGDCQGAAEAMEKARQAMRDSDCLEGNKDLDSQLDSLRQCREAMCKGCPAPIPASGQRPESTEGETGSFTSKIKGQTDPKGQMELTGFAPGSSFKKKGAAEIAGDIKQASQEAPEAIDRQRIPRAAADMAKGYFENFRKLGEEEKGKK